MSIPAGIGKLHVNNKLSFGASDTSKTATINAIVEDSGEMRIMPNPSSEYMIYIHNTSSQTATIKLYNTWTDSDDNSRETDITSGGETVSAGSSILLWVSGLFMGENSKIEATVPAGEGSSWSLYYQTRRP